MLTTTSQTSFIQTPPFMPRQAKKSDSPSVVAIGEHGQAFLDMAVVGLTMFPGFLLTTPGLILFILPVIAIGVLAAAVGGVVAVGVLATYAGLRLARGVTRAVAHRVPRSLPQRSVSAPASGNVAMPSAS